jgi:hypothetical protein
MRATTITPKQPIITPKQRGSQIFSMAATFGPWGSRD